MIELTVVVLPIPFRPMSVITSPTATDKDTPNSTWLRPYEVSNSFTSSIMIGVCLVAEIRVADPPVRANLLRRPGDNGLPGHKHGNPISEREHGSHVVFHQEDRIAALETSQQSFDFRA